MFTEKVGRFTTDHPWIGITLILLITAASLFSMMNWPMEEKFENEDFLPDVEVAKANSLYSETFTSSYSFAIVVRGAEGNLLTPSGLKDMASISDLISDDETYQRYKDISSPAPSSPASALYDMRLSVDHAEDIIHFAEVVEGSLGSARSLNTTSHDLMEGLESANLSDPSDVDRIIDPFKSSIDEFRGSAMIPSSISATPEDMFDYYSGFNTTGDFTGEIGYLLAYNFSSIELRSAMTDLNIYSSTAGTSIGSLLDARALIEDVITEGNAYPNVTLSLQGAIDDIDDSLGLLKDLLQITGMQGNQLVFGQVSQDFYVGQFFLLNFLTEDFDPMNGAMTAKGALMMVSLDYSLGEMADEGNLDKVLEIEGNLSELVREFDEVSDQSFNPLGSAQLGEKINEASTESMRILFPLALLFVLAILFFIYRSIIDIVINVLALLFAIIWMYGFGSVMGYASNPMIMAVPVLLVGLGIDYGIHLTMRYREEIRKGNSVRGSLNAMSGSVGMALLLATFTTVFAFLSNISSPVSLLLQFGVLAAVGIFSSFVIMMIFVPSVKKLIDGWKAGRNKVLFRGIREGECDVCEIEKQNKKLINRTILGLSIRAEKHPIMILTIVIGLTLVMGGFAVQSKVTFDVNDFLPDGLQETKDINFLLSEFKLGGSGDNGIIIIEGSISSPEVLLAMNKVMEDTVDLGSRYISLEGTGDSVRPKADFILYSMKDTAQTLGAFDPANPFLENYSAIFDINTGLPLEDADSGDIGDVLVEFHSQFPSLARRMIHVEDGEVDMAVITFTVGTENDDQAWKLYDELKELVAPLEALEGESIDNVSITGSTILMAVIIESINQSQITSLLLTIIVSFIVLTIAFFIEEKSLFLGAVATLPVVFCVIWIAGVMYVTGIPLNVMTITIGALTVGLGITYGIHITHRFIEDEKNENDLMEASKKTVLNTGAALFGAALTTVGGFGMLSFAKMPPLQQFGQVTALAITFSFLSSVIVLPVLLILWAKTRRRWRQRTGRELFNGVKRDHESSESAN
ncbi:MAG: efflux RND transporter permease subunit [Thermoplasmatota archaeon]